MKVNDEMGGEKLELGMGFLVAGLHKFSGGVDGRPGLEVLDVLPDDAVKVNAGLGTEKLELRMEFGVTGVGSSVGAGDDGLSELAVSGVVLSDGNVKLNDEVGSEKLGLKL